MKVTARSKQKFEAPEDLRFIVYNYRCSKKDSEEEPVILEVNAIAPLIGAVSIYTNTDLSIEECFVEATLQMIDSIEAEFTILGISHR